MTKEDDITANVKMIETVWIPMKDGRKLAARLFLPKDTEVKVPAILEYLPYRRRDGTRARDDETHYWFAANGYGCARVDIAGTGDSDGLVQDEYHLREQADGLEIIEWLASQYWCSGAVGMIGISWGGFNGLQIAAHRPKALKAVVALCATTDRYHEDVHYMGGCLLADNLDWGGAFFTYGALPPDPRVVGNTWRELWKERIDGLDLFPAIWLEHQRRDDYWRHGSVIEDFSSIEIPVLAVSGWADGYTKAVFQLVQNMSTDSKGIVGPWGHRYPHRGVPGPAIGFLQECKRWWDRWLKGIDTGVENEPDFRLWLQRSLPPSSHHEERPGRWIGVDSTLAGEMRTYRLDADDIPAIATICSPQATGVSGGEWCAYALGNVAPELPTDQRNDDLGSLVFDWENDADLDIVGQPVLKIRVAADCPQAHLTVRLCDVHPDGKVERVTFGVLNLSHRDSHEFPSPIVAGEFFDAQIPLNEIAQTITAGHKIRISISTSYWPMIWPSPTPATISVETDSLRLEIPVLAAGAEIPTCAFEAPVHAPAMPISTQVPGSETRVISYDIGTRTTEFRINRDDGWFVIDDIATAANYAKEKLFRITDDDPLSNTHSIRCCWQRKRPDWNVRVETEVTMKASPIEFILSGTVHATEGETLVAERSFFRKIKRDNL
jgi:putative CocE/NonD family hydrolase